MMFVGFGFYFSVLHLPLFTWPKYHVWQTIAFPRRPAYAFVLFVVMSSHYQRPCQCPCEPVSVSFPFRLCLSRAASGHTGFIHLLTHSLWHLDVNDVRALVLNLPIISRCECSPLFRLGPASAAFGLASFNLTWPGWTSLDFSCRRESMPKKITDCFNLLGTGRFNMP